ncbi:hypothetical protein F5Y14DRAFT_452469 [Nemania sp. NC0429]|nr:hypothetical protein F5Y14DRAFT_452469 [Nemania sp. NC0429]
MPSVPKRQDSQDIEAEIAILRRRIAGLSLEEPIPLPKLPPGKSLLLNLPSELRIAIYEQVAVQRLIGPRTNPYHGFTRTLVPPSLARVNKQLRHEVLTEYYRQNQFWIDIPLVSGPGYLNFMAQCTMYQEYLPLIKTLRCEARVAPSEDWSLVFLPHEDKYLSDGIPKRGAIFQVKNFTPHITTHTTFSELLLQIHALLNLPNKHKYRELVHYTFRYNDRASDTWALGHVVSFLANHTVLGQMGRSKLIYVDLFDSLDSQQRLPGKRRAIHFPGAPRNQRTRLS